MGPLNTSQRDLIKRVVQHSMHLQAMVNDLLEIAEVEAGNMLNLQVEAVDPLSAALNVIPKAEMRRGSKAITIEPVIGMTGPVPMIWANRAALERVFFHLLDNAVKFIEHKGRVTIEFAERDGVLDIAVQDTGIGISAENLKRIFEHLPGGFPAGAGVGRDGHRVDGGEAAARLHARDHTGGSTPGRARASRCRFRSPAAIPCAWTPKWRKRQTAAPKPPCARAPAHRAMAKRPRAISP